MQDSWALRRLQGVARRFGLAVFPRREDHHYVPRYYGRTAHKQRDIRALHPFGELAAEAIAHGRTYLDYDRLFTLWQALENVARLYGSEHLRSVEAGVYRGGSSYFLATAASRLGLDLEHHAIDTFEGHPGEDLKESDLQVTTTFRNTSYERVREYLSRLPSVEVHRGRIQDEAPTLGPGPFHVVHLDMDIYEPTLFGLGLFVPRLSVGGVVVVDDYGHETCPGVRRAVDEFIAADRSCDGLHLLTGQFVLVKHAPAG